MHVLPAALPQVLLFCTMTRALDVVEDYLSWRGFPALRLDGNTGAAERGELVRRFNDPGGLDWWWLLYRRRNYGGYCA